LQPKGAGRDLQLALKVTTNLQIALRNAPAVVAALGKDHHTISIFDKNALYGLPTSAFLLFLSN
jgi:hypothetical protein